MDDNPRPCTIPPYNDFSYMFLNNSGKPNLLSFPAVLDTNGMFQKSGAYFNLPNPVGNRVSIHHCHAISLSYICKQNNGPKGLKNAHAQFELKPLKNDYNDMYIPEQALDASTRAIIFF